MGTRFPRRMITACVAWASRFISVYCLVSDMPENGDANSTASWRMGMEQPHTTTSDHLGTSDIDQSAFIEDLTIGTANISDCLTAAAPFSYKLTKGTLIMDRGESQIPSKYQECTINIEVPKGQIVAMNILKFQGGCVCNSSLVMLISDEFESEKRALKMLHAWEVCNKPEEWKDTLYSYTEWVSVILMMYTHTSCKLHLNFKAMPATVRPQLEIKFTSSSEGFIQTPGFDGMSPYPENMDSVVKVDIPEHHDVMTSFSFISINAEYMTCRYDHASLYLNGNKPGDLVWKACTDFVPLPALFNADVLYVKFVSDNTPITPNAGFKLLFSFHKHTVLPEKLPDGMWNCSVPYFVDFQRHFRCNLAQECAGAEDEMRCPHTSEHCGPGLIAVGDNCYWLRLSETLLDWHDAYRMCRRSGAHIVSLNTPKEWHDVIGLLRHTHFAIFIGFSSVKSIMSNKCTHCYQWDDGTVVYYSPLDDENKFGAPMCGHFMPSKGQVINWYCFSEDQQRHVLCEMDGANKIQNNDDASRRIPRPSAISWGSNVLHVNCPKGHVTHQFLSCDLQTDCFVHDYGSMVTCDAPLTPLPPSFTCKNGIERVAYSLVCDHRSDCRDDSDEDFCVFPRCKALQFNCGNEQCVSLDSRCDGTEECVNGADEKLCFGLEIDYHASSIPPPATIELDKKGDFVVTRLNSTDLPCPDTHFQCPGNGFCLPVYVLCNGAYDCPGKEDERSCDSYECPGFYRCRASDICLHPKNMCDGVFQCPQHDDEVQCDLTCPENCTCYGLAFYCHHPFPVHQYPDLRYMNAGGSSMSLEDFVGNNMLIFLSLARCSLKELKAIDLPNLHTLDLSNNDIIAININHLVRFSVLRSLSLSGNPLAVSLLTHNEGAVPAHIRSLDLSGSKLPEIDGGLFRLLPDLQMLNLSQSGTRRVSGHGFQSLKDLRHLDLRGCPMTQFPRDIFQGLDLLNSVHADNYKLCCRDTLPKTFNLARCHAPTDEISSCEALLRSNFYRVVLTVFAVLALMSNLGSFVYRVFINKSKSNSGFRVFVTHLCVSDCLMGVYLGVIGVADRLFQGTYLWMEVTWKRSAACQTAGFLSFLSSEVSVFIICLITLDRFLVLRFPFRAVHFRRKSAHVACVVVWIVGFVLAGLPLFITSHWEFYSQTSICIPLPITKKDVPGHSYSFAIMIVFNFVLFLLIAAGQVTIYWSIQANSMPQSDVSASQSKEMKAARRLLTVVISDFLCWFPVGLLGLLASNGVPIPGEVNVAVAIIVLPLNSAFNPFLYTLNTMMERRRQERETQLLLRLSKAQKTVNGARKQPCTKEEAWDLLKSWVSHGVVESQEIVDHFMKPES